MAQNWEECQEESKGGKCQTQHRRVTRQSQPSKVSQRQVSYWEGELKTKRRNWDKVEKKHYINILFKHHRSFVLPIKLKQLKKTYRSMSNAILTRNNKQCSNFHRAMKGKYVNVHTILDEMSEFLHPKQYRLWHNSRHRGGEVKGEEEVGEIYKRVKEEVMVNHEGESRKEVSQMRQKLRVSKQWRMI